MGWLLGNKQQSGGTWKPMTYLESLGSIWGDRYAFILTTMNNKDNIRHYIVARQV